MSEPRGRASLALPQPVPKAHKRSSLQNQEAPKEPNIRLSLKQSDLPKKQSTIFALRQPRKSLLIKHDDFDREWQDGDGEHPRKIVNNSRLFFKKLTKKIKHF
jgi:hypothetical protein